MRVFKLNYLAQERVYANQVEYKVTCSSLHLDSRLESPLLYDDIDLDSLDKM